MRSPGTKRRLIPRSGVRVTRVFAVSDLASTPSPSLIIDWSPGRCLAASPPRVLALRADRLVQEILHAPERRIPRQPDPLLPVPARPVQLRIDVPSPTDA